MHTPTADKSTLHTLPPDERESILGLDNGELPTESERQKQRQQEIGITGSRHTGGGGALDTIADTVSKAFGGKSK